MSLEEIKQLIKTHHDPTLVKATESPNGNIQTLLFNDGEIMSTKGGWAFLQRSFFSIKPPINNLDITMPMTLNSNTFMIVRNEEIANNIRTIMLEYSKKNIN